MLVKVFGINRNKRSQSPKYACEGGRIVNYLKALLPDKRNDVLFAGYQAQGTLGREIQSGSHTVDIDNQPIEANAQIHTISGYSAHADQSDLLKFVTGIPAQPKAVQPCI